MYIYVYMCFLTTVYIYNVFPEYIDKPFFEIKIRVFGRHLILRFPEMEFFETTNFLKIYPVS